MQKKSLALLMLLCCAIVQPHDSEHSVFSSMPEDAKNQIPATLREEIDARWKKDQDDKLNKEIDEYFEGILLKEFEKAGSIDEVLKAKEENNKQLLEKRKLQVCNCTRRRFWDCYSAETEVEKSDTVFKNEIDKQNLRYKQVADEYKEKVTTIQKEINIAAEQYKNKIKILKKIHKSVALCGNDLICHKDNGIFEGHLSSDYREGIINRIFIAALQSCTSKKIAEEDVLAQVWEKNPLLVHYQNEAKNYNTLIDKGLNPDLDEQEDRQD